MTATSDSVLAVRSASLTLADRTLWSGLDLDVREGEFLAVLGANGSGKTTLLRALTGELPLSAGQVRRALGLRIVYFSQLRELETPLTLRRALAPDSDSVVYQDRVVHVASYASRFLFTGEQMNQPVSRLSGGERARVLIARLMLQPADILILDEPTNDLDIPTLEILEEALLEFPGALVLVTHDRYLLDRVTNAVIGLDGRGHAAMFADYLQYDAWREDSAAAIRTPALGRETKTELPVSSPPARKKLSYMEQREYDAIEARVEAADARLQAARARIEDHAVATDAAALTQALEELDAARKDHDAVYERWAELSDKIGG